MESSLTDVKGQEMANLPKSVPKKYQARIMHWEDERECGNALIVSLKDGWMFPGTDCHTSGFDTVKEAIEGLRDTVPCYCADCHKSLVAAAASLSSRNEKRKI